MMPYNQLQTIVLSNMLIDLFIKEAFVFNN